jgi:hypothetical protein
MITTAIRRGLLENFPFGTPLAIVAPAGTFEDAVTARNDPATTLHAGASGLPAMSSNVIVEGLDAVSDPAALLAALRAATPAARLFALIANAAHLPALAAFFAGATMAYARPLVRGDIEQLMSAAGWNAFAIEPIAGEAPFAPASIPGAVQLGGLTFALADAAALERVAPAAYLAIADPV